MSFKTYYVPSEQCFSRYFFLLPLNCLLHTYKNKKHTKSGLSIHHSISWLIHLSFTIPQENQIPPMWPSPPPHQQIQVVWGAGPSVVCPPSSGVSLVWLWGAWVPCSTLQWLVYGVRDRHSWPLWYPSLQHPGGEREQEKEREFGEWEIIKGIGRKEKNIGTLSSRD